MRRKRWKSRRPSKIATPTICIRFVGLSMRSHAVFTWEMRSRLLMLVRLLIFDCSQYNTQAGFPGQQHRKCIQPKVMAMSDLKAQFDAAVAASKTLSERPDNMTLLKLYSLFKQGSKATCRASVRALPKWSGVRNTMPGPS